MKLLLTGAFSWTAAQMNVLRNLGVELLFVEREDAPLTDNEKSVDVVICNWLFAHHKMEEFENLKYVQLLSAGMERVPLEYIKKHNIQIRNARGVYSIPMAEFVLGGVLQLLKSSRFFYKNQQKKCWEKNRNLIELFNKRVLIIGTGSVGTEIAKRFLAFTEFVRGVDLSSSDIPYFEEVVPIEKIDEELSVADIVVVTLPLTSKTYHLFDSERFSKMKDNAIFVNVARGGLVDESALSNALDNKLYGAVLDVFESEPLPPNSDFWKRENVILSPHNSFVSENNNNRMWNVIYQNLEGFLCLEGKDLNKIRE